jgi:hypothetical protein
MSRSRSWQVPYSIERLTRLCRTWDFLSDAEDLPDEPNGEPRVALACRRLMEWIRNRRDDRDATYEPWEDDSLAEFRVSDVSIILDEYRRLSRLADRVQDALGPPSVQMRWNRKLRRMEE